MRPVNDRQFMTLISALLPNVDLDQLNPEAVKAVIDGPKLAGEHFVRFINAGCRMPEQLVVPAPRPWRDVNGVIYFTVVSDGTTGEQWIARLEGKGNSVGRYAKNVLRSADFVPSPAGTEYKVAVLKGSLFTSDKRTTANIRAEATRCVFTKPHPEVACLIRDRFTDDDIKAMGLCRIVAMHDPINDSDGTPSLLGANRGDIDYSLNAYHGRPGLRWHIESGFASIA